MNTPICDFVRKYIDKQTIRAHMPGHKGTSLLGFEKYDITEITGADSLYSPDGIIKKSEDNASYLFGCPTFYSTEGSSQCIRAMLYLVMLNSEKHRPKIAAGRNAHKTFITAATMLDFDINWLCPDDGTYLSCPVTAEYLENYLLNASVKPTAVYVTSPDYLGNILNIKEIANVCHRFGVLLTVDNAHGAYLKFLPQSLHPIDLGADMCCDSAHKTLPVLTGGAYLHISPHTPSIFANRAKSAMAMFGSTSPSYLILQSLDAANVYLESHTTRLNQFIPKIEELKSYLVNHGYSLSGNEPLKLTILPKPYGYTGIKLAEILEKQGVFCEFFDPDSLVMMLTPETGDDGIRLIRDVLTNVPQKNAVQIPPPKFTVPYRVYSPREASFAAFETVSVVNAAGRVLAATEVGCPPAVPIVMCGERIDGNTVKCLKYYGFEKCTVVSEK